MWLTILLWAAAFALNLLLTPKPQNAKPASLADFDAPTAEEGREIPVLFGTRTVLGPNVIWYGDLDTTSIKGARRYGFFGPRQVIGYTYSVGMHMGLCHGLGDSVRQIRVGQQVIYSGALTDTVSIDLPELFGGSSQEGGVVGLVDIDMGGPTQPVNSYLDGILGPDIPAFRGVICCILHQVNLGNSTSLKPWDFRVQRIYLRSDGSAQWYPEKAGVTGGFRLFWYQRSVGIDEARMGLEFRSGGVSMGAVSWSDYSSDDLWVLRTTRGVVPTGADTVRIWIDMRKTAEVNNEAFVDDISISWDGNSLTVVNPGAESGTTGWTTTAGTLVGAAGSGPHSGSNYFSGGTDDLSTAYQDVSLSALSPSIAAPILDMNPAHIIRECLIDRLWGMGYNSTDIDDTSFTLAADTLYAEGFGLSMLWQHEEEIQEFISTVLSHIDGLLYVSPETGKFVLKLIRRDYQISALTVVDEDDIVQWNEVKRRQPNEAVNSVNVTYWDEDKVQDGSVTVHNIAAVQQASGVIAASRQYPGITYKELAIRVATRDVRTLGSGLASGSFTAKRTIDSFNPGDPFRLVSDLQNFTGEIMRVMEITHGDGRDNQVGITFIQDVFHLEAAVLVDDGSQDEEVAVATAEAVEPRLVVEMPYHELVLNSGVGNATTLLAGDPDFGATMAAGSKPTQGSLNAAVWVDAGTGYVDSAENLTFCPSCALDDDLGPLATDLVVAVTDWVDQSLTVVGYLAAIDDEIVRIDAFSSTSLTLARGCLDTVPAAHLTGAPVIIFTNRAETDLESYTAGDTPDIKLLTRVGAVILALADAPANTVTMNSRAIRPYPVGRFKVDGSFAPTLVAGTAALTWTHRDRVGQNTVVPHDDVSYGPEAGVTYRVDIYGITGLGVIVGGVPFLTTNVGTALLYNWDIVGDPAPLGSIDARMIVTAERDGYDSWQAAAIQAPIEDAGSAVGAAHGTGSAASTSILTAASVGSATGVGLANGTPNPIFAADGSASGGGTATGAS